MLRILITSILSIIFIFQYNICIANTDTNIPSNVFTAAFAAYTSHIHRTDILIIVDFDLPSTAKRLWIINVKTKEILLNTWVTHGEGSGRLYATSFSNAFNSHKSSLGTFITEGVYQGRHGLSIRLKGLDKGLNSNAEARDIVIHSASYIGDNKTGTSWGCFAVREQDMATILTLVHPGSIIFAYHS